jgi:hypothetical protein
VEKVEVQGTTDNMFYFMFKTLEIFVCMNVEILGGKFISIGRNNNNVFQSSKIGVTT